MTTGLTTTDPTTTDPTTTDLIDLIALDRTAVQESLRVLRIARDADWERPSTCAGWTLRDLVAHMAAQHHGFAAAARGAGDDRTYWIAPDLGGDPFKVYDESVRHVLAAFAEGGVLERGFTLPEIGGTFTGRVAVGFHLLDYVVHSWDVAATLGVRLDLPRPVVEAALDIARRVPKDPDRRGPGAAFAPVLPTPEEASPLDEMLALLGRSPRWRDR
ncbi:TIGR03086 family metal-binding protein [Streptomyces sp. MZ04]|uniref:TIGR03086 family metal-binding protein n=1 Tax=Streptomyces sp. MZ04 TaxID=2559236 RepID=UPI00107EE361|nr:TIGR03086 family metal-binding protein [Streptomyces sp. MZ04]TGA89933.1 TIGR03086 family protein [Streptomyces sp. MZ04]